MTSNPGEFDDLLRTIRSSRLPTPLVRRATRESAGLSIRQAAGALGVAPMTVLRWEQGASVPRPDHAIRYRRFLDVLEEAVR